MNSSIFYLSIFLVGGFFGWFIDTAYRSYFDKRYSSGTLIPCFSIIYALAAVLIYLIFQLNISLYGHVMLGTTLAVLLEFISGFLANRFLGRRLWDYTPSKYDYLGHIDVQHSFYWFLLVVFYRLLSGYILK